MIRDIDTNYVYLADKLKEFYPNTFTRLTMLFDEMGISWGEVPHTNDIWVRDYMPIQIEEDDYLLYKYYPDYLNNEKDRKYITDAHKCCEALGIKYREMSTLLDGGNVVACGNKYVMTCKVEQTNEASVLAELKEALKHEIIIIPWHKITDDEPYGHSDGFIHWCEGKLVLMNNHRDTDLNEALAIKGKLNHNGFTVKEITFDDIVNQNKDLNWAYVNYLHVGNKIIMPAFGIAEDLIALDIIKKANPDCEVRTFRMRDIVNAGGALHCITWNIKR